MIKLSRFRKALSLIDLRAQKKIEGSKKEGETQESVQNSPQIQIK